MRRFHKPEPSAKALDILMKRAGISLSPDQISKLWRYHSLLRDRNQDRDLTRITGFEPMVLKHYVDCMIVTQFVNLPSPLLDVGTGAGFPGIPLKIQLPQLEITLAEPRPRRVEFLREAIRTLGLRSIEVFDHKVTSQSFAKPVAGIITRALETMEKTLARTQGCLPVGGQAIFLKGPNVHPEVKLVRERFGKRFELVQDQAYTLPHSSHERRLLVYLRRH